MEGGITDTIGSENAEVLNLLIECLT